ncbi:hypothetical protein [Maribacter sp. 1_2014MBL_MicDiv]|uniref:hypothetical protein n=1 Tax=Maribacter sp. 1_2014MBL_MicDiv TaxID=1644130 RepID=UPI0008F45A7A|nr:hypothetical protein [Maribacter sp. 1_2014MBL_MicDiv]APA64565.1 hypothetical protein YQ22_09670 [Maribacter sp. 1_2014MBL_MicDiv]
MEDKEIRELFTEYNSKLDSVLSLNKASLERIKLENTKKQARFILVKRSIEVAFFLLVMVVLGKFTVNHWGKLHLVVSGILVQFFALIALIGSIGQLVLAAQVDYAKPIVEIREKIEKINIHSLLFIKLAFLSAPVWWAYPIVALTYFFNFDIFPYLDSAFVYRYVIINALLLIPLLWFLKKLSYKNLHIKWVRRLLDILASNNTKRAVEFLKDIEEFKK